MNSFKDLLKKSIPYLISFVVLLLVNILLFYPQLEDKTMPSGDMTTYLAKSHEAREFYKETGETTHWNPSMFSGMPEQLLTLGRSQNKLKTIKNAFKFYIKRPIGLFLQIGLVCFISFCLLGMNPWLSLLASLALGLNTNFMVLYSAGHVTKLNVISFFPLIICGTILCFREEFLKGAVAVALGTSLAIYYDHIQMVYYLIFGMLVIGIVYLIYSIKNKSYVSFGKGAAIAIAAASLAGLSNFSQLYSAKSFADDTMRGLPILDKKDDEQAKSSSEVLGLEWEYAMRWSNDIKDALAMFIPRYVGGANGERVSADSEAGKLMVRIGGKKDKGVVRTSGYWGTLPFTGGPSYMGVPLVLLFILSLFIIDPRIRWSAIGVVILFVLLSMGKNVSWLNRTLFDYFPLFNKFRAPNSILFLMPIFLVLPAFLGLNKIFKSEDKSQYLKPLYYSTGITGGFALFVLLFGSSMYDFIKPAELQYDEQVQSILRKIRISLQQGDATRTLGFVLVTAGVLWAYLKGKIKGLTILVPVLALIFLADLIPVKNRYVNNSDFIKQRKFDAQFTPSQNDKLIFSQEPKGKGFYRVLDLSVNTFNDAKPSYHHHQVGGYDAAKLQRYMDMIDQYISVGNMEVLNMLNTKYIITQDNRVSPNPQANGTAWFVKNIVTANTPREEIDAVGTMDTDSTAVVLMSEFSDQNITAGNGIGSIELVEYQPNKLTYKSSSSSDQIAIFSEVWYGPNKGWYVTIDGQEAKHFRANYILRGMHVPAGEHEIVFEFKPKAKGGWISLVSSLGILLLTLASIGYYLKEEGIIKV